MVFYAYVIITKQYSEGDPSMVEKIDTIKENLAILFNLFDNGSLTIKLFVFIALIFVLIAYAIFLPTITVINQLKPKRK